MSLSYQKPKLIRIRKEPFGYILFDRNNRQHHFVKTDEHIEQMNSSEVSAFLSRYFDSVDSQTQYEFIKPPDHSMELSAPIGMYLEITQRCIFRCNHCYKPATLPGSLMSFEQFKNLIDELHNIGIFEIRLCGNEPTASPYFFDLCHYIKEKNLYLGVNTCGFFSSDLKKNSHFVSELIKLAPDLVVVSIDGPKATHDVIRREGSWDRAVSLLSQLDEAAIPRRINTLISRSTIPHLEFIAKLASDMGCGVSYLPLRSIGRETDLKEEERLDCQAMYSAVKKITELRLRFPQTRLLTYFDILTQHPDYHHPMEFNKPCPARKNGFVAFDGSYFPCDFLRYLGERWYIGNITAQSFWNLWTTSKVFQEFRQLQHSKCNKCRFYMTHCYGGCISGSIASSGQPDDELCFVDILINSEVLDTE